MYTQHHVPQSNISDVDPQRWGYSASRAVDCGVWHTQRTLNRSRQWSRPRPTPQPKPEPLLPPDLSALAIGMERADMVKKVGKPWMSISSVEDSVLVETCTYRSGSDTVTVTLREGKVATSAGLENLAAKQALAPAHDPVTH